MILLYRLVFTLLLPKYHFIIISTLPTKVPLLIVLQFLFSVNSKQSVLLEDHTIPLIFLMQLQAYRVSINKTSTSYRKVSSTAILL